MDIVLLLHADKRIVNIFLWQHTEWKLNDWKKFLIFFYSLTTLTHQAMENYTKGETSEVEMEPLFEVDQTGVDMKVNAGSKIRNLMGYAMNKVKVRLTPDQCWLAMHWIRSRWERFLMGYAKLIWHWLLQPISARYFFADKLNIEWFSWVIFISIQNQ